MTDLTEQPLRIHWASALGPLLHAVTASRAQHSGNWQEAQTHFGAALTHLPNDPGLLRLRAQLAVQQGDHAGAADYLKRAAALAPANETIACDLAQALLATGDLPQALRAAQHAVTLQPTWAPAQWMLASIQCARCDWNAAEQAALAALKAAPEWDAVLLLLAQAQHEQQRPEDAKATLRALLSTKPLHAQANNDLGWLLYRQGEWVEARRLLESAAALVDADPLAASREWDSVVLQNLGRILLDGGELAAAMQRLEQAIERSPNSPRACLFIGMAWQELGEPDEALQWYERSLQLHPDPEEAHEQWERLASLAIKSEQFDKALELLSKVLSRHPHRVQALALRASAHLQQGDLTSALDDLRTAIAKAPTWANLHASLGQALANAGDTADAKASFQAALGHNSDCIPALVGLLNMAKTRADAPLKHQALELLRTQALSAPRRASLHFGLATYYDATKAWSKAASHMALANRLRKAAKAERNEAYDPKAYEAYVDELIALFTPEFFARMAEHGDSSARPVFIVGMPRSGTTLCEQIIASHPQAHGAGERNFANKGLQGLANAHGLAQASALQALATATPAQVQAVARWHLQQLDRLDDKALRVVDKMPDNFSLLGWLAILFPNARFVHCQRDLRDVALSCWLTDFSRIVWANDMDHLVHRIRQYRRLMAHWQKVLPVPLHTQRYERLVADQRHESQRLLEAVGLPWDERCMKFFETRRVVRTASVNQVRQPMYQRAVARWQRYESMLAPVCAELADDPAHVRPPDAQHVMLAATRTITR